MKKIIIIGVVICTFGMFVFGSVIYKKSPVYMRKQVSTNQEKEPQKDMLIKLGEQDIPEEQERLLQDVFEKLSCTQIHMYRNETNKILQIVLEDVYIDDKNVYCQSLYFCKNGNAEMGEEIFPNWYYEVLFYT